VVVSALLFWLPVCGPLPELRISVPAQMIYLFVTSLVPTVPGTWLVFAEGAVYKVYDIPQRMFGISVTTDQQVAGAIMKLGAGTYLWVLITMLFFKWSARQDAADREAAAERRAVLTFERVQAEFEANPAPPVEQPHP
jgi:putative membrane protein